MTHAAVSIAPAYSPAPSLAKPEPTRLTNIAELLLRAARRHPRFGIYTVSGEGERAESLTYPALLEQSLRILGGLQGLHGRGNVVLLLEHARDCIPAFWACVLGGYVPCLITPIRNDAQRWARHLEHIDELLDEPLLVTTGALRSELPQGFACTELNELRGHSPAAVNLDAGLEDPAALVLTSGSTGNSKAVVLTHGNFLAAMEGKTERQQLTDADVTLNWISFDHIAALSEMHMLSLYSGAMQLHVDAAAILADPMLFLRLIHRYRVSVTFTPNFLLGQINTVLQSMQSSGALDALKLDLSCLRHIVSGGEAIVVDTARRFLELLKPQGLNGNVLWPAFGMTETCAGCIYSREFPEKDAGCEFASLGSPIEGMQMRVVDDAGNEVAPGESGELQMRGPMIFGRYHNNEAATEAAFTSDGWMRSGDLGRIDDGRLSLVGRSKDSIIVSGVNYFSHELETVLQPLDGIERSFVAAFPTRPKGADTEQLVITFAASFPLSDEAKLYQLVVAVRNTAIMLWGFRPALIVPLPRDAFPKTSLGKIQRSLLRKRLEAGDLSTHIAFIAEVTSRQLGGYLAPQGATEASVAGIYADIFQLDAASVSATASFFDLGGTSLDIVKLKQQLERRFAIADLPVATILQNPTVRELAVRVDPELRNCKQEYDPVVPLQLSGSKTPVFCVHPGVGEILVFVNLAKYFVNDRPFYGLRARGLNEGEDYFNSFDEMVEVYTKAIRQRQPQGPYALAGYSYGAPVAFEIAKRLEAQGERVGFLGSIDMPPVILRPLGTVQFIESAVILAFFLALLDTKEQLLDLPKQLRSMSPPPDPCEYLLKLARPERLAELDLNLEKFRAWTSLVQALTSLGETYSPSGSVESVTVFSAQPFFGTSQEWMDTQLKRWDEFTRAPNRYIEVPGEHHTLMDTAHVGRFQAVLRAELDRALGDGPAM